ncbi:MAG TPA: hypothetical protein DCY89_09945 [Gammaproteobacteria bacterium]|nr:hypothetical protein [Gammaproteobacteria bacterium]
MNESLQLLIPLGLVLGWCGYQLVRGHHRLRAVTGLPLSRIRSAAQGYAQIEGLVRPAGEQWLVSPLQGRRCVYYRLQIVRRSPGKRTLRSGTRQVPEFRLQDATGECVVETEGADFGHIAWSPTYYGPTDDPSRAGRRPWLGIVESYSFREQVIGIDDPVFVLGDLHAPEGPDRSGLLRLALGELKQDKARLHARYDQNGDGVVSGEEWEQARIDTERELSASLLAAAETIDTTVRVRQPEHRHQPFVIAGDLCELQLTRRLRLQIGLAALGCLVTVGLLLQIVAH